MAKRNKKSRKSDIISPIITVLKDGFLGGLLLIAISHGVHVFTQAQEEDYTARQAVFNQFMISKGILIDSINQCLKASAPIDSNYTQRFQARKELVNKTEANKWILNPNTFFAISQYTRLDDSNKLKNLCALKTEELEQLKIGINRLEGKLREEINSRAKK